MLRRGTNSLLQDVGALFAKEQLESNKKILAERLSKTLCKNVKEINSRRKVQKVLSRRETFQDLQKLIKQSEMEEFSR